MAFWELVANGLLFAEAAADADRPPPNLLLQFAPFIIIGILFYMMLLRPEKKKRAEMDRMLKNIKKNDRIVTIGGIHGTVVNTTKESDEVTIKVDEASNTKLKVNRSAISRVVLNTAGATSKAEAQ